MTKKKSLGEELDEVYSIIEKAWLKAPKKYDDLMYRVSKLYARYMLLE